MREMESVQRKDYIPIDQNARSDQQQGDHTIMLKSKIGPQILAFSAGTLAILSMGFHAGWPSPSLVKLLADDSDIPVTSAQGAWIVAFVMVGAIVGSIFTSISVDTCGRKKLLFLTFVPNLISFVLIAISWTYWMLYLARIIAGFAWGMIMTVLPMYLGEIADIKLRPILGSLIGNMMNLGILVVFCIGPWMDRATLAYAGTTLPLAFALIFVWMPESPYFFLMKNDIRGATKSLVWLRGTPNVNEELINIQQTIESDQKASGTYTDLVSTRVNRRALVAGMTTMFAQEFSGIMVIIAYSQLIFEESGATLSSSTSSIIIGIVQLLSSCAATSTANLAGRRTLLMISTFGSSLFLAFEAFYFHLRNVGIDVSYLHWIPLTAFVGFMVVYALGLGALPWTVLSEIFPSNVKAKAVMVCFIVNSSTSLCATQIYQRISDAYGIQYSFWSFSVLTCVFGILIYFIVPETRNKSLHEIQQLFEARTRSKC